MSETGHLRPGPTSSRPANVRYASDRYRNGEPLKATRRATTRHRLACSRPPRPKRDVIQIDLRNPKRRSV